MIYASRKTHILSISMEKIRAIIVDDEEPGRRNLESLLTNYCPEVELTGVAASAMEASKLISTVKPALVFLDINMPELDGFGFLDMYSERDFLVVFVTAHDEFGIRAVKANAVDYLLKPISITELQMAVKKAAARLRASGTAALAGITGRIAVTHLNGFEIVELEAIVRLEADDNYTTLYTTSQGAIVVSRTIKDFETVLDPGRFVRIHKTHIINLGHLKKYSKIDGGTVTMSDGSTLTVAKRRHAGFMEKINNHLLTLK